MLASTTILFSVTLATLVLSTLDDNSVCLELWSRCGIQIKKCQRSEHLLGLLGHQPLPRGT